MIIDYELPKLSITNMSTHEGLCPSEFRRGEDILTNPRAIIEQAS